MNILGIDTATETLALCLKRNDNKISVLSANLGFKHASRLLDAVEYLLCLNELAVNELDLIACSLGPGSFTGLRIGLATAKGLAAGSQCPLIGVSTLEALAYPFGFSDTVVVPLIDAKKNQFYAALFREGKRITGDLDITPQVLMEKLKDYKKILLTGPMAAAFFPVCSNLPGLEVHLDPQYAIIKPAALVELGIKYYQEQGGDPDTLAPVYIRRSDAEINISG